MVRGTWWLASCTDSTPPARGRCIKRLTGWVISAAEVLFLFLESTDDLRKNLLAALPYFGELISRFGLLPCGKQDPSQTVADDQCVRVLVTVDTARDGEHVPVFLLRRGKLSLFSQGLCEFVAEIQGGEIGFREYCATRGKGFSVEGSRFGEAALITQSTGQVVGGCQSIRVVVSQDFACALT